jgi:PEP-CTERM motif
MNFTKTARAGAAIAALSLSTLAQASLVSVIADFETGLSGWTERNPALPSAEIVADPLTSGRGNVLTFQRVGSSGTLFSVDTSSSADGRFVLSFDYLGIPPQGAAPTYSGGYIGVVRGMDEPGAWIGGAGSYASRIALIDDSAWHSYTYTFTSEWGGSLRVMVEDWDGAGTVARNAFFDNISLQAVPEPTSIALVGLALLAMGASAKRSKNKRA